MFLLSLGLGVTPNQLSEGKDVSLSIRVSVRVAIARFLESKYEKVDLGEVGGCNK